MTDSESTRRKTKSERCVDLAGNLITAVTEGDDRQAGVLLKRAKRQGIQSSVLVILALIAAGALKKAHGDDWKQHTTEFPDNLERETE